MTAANTSKKSVPATYQTMIKSEDPDTIANLTGWRRPKTAYVILEYPQYNLKSDGVGSWGKGLATVNAESRAEVLGQVRNILNKGGRILDYGNFPKLTDKDPERAAKARLYSQGSGQEPWGPLEDYLLQQMRGDKKWGAEKAEMQSEIDALKAKLEEATNKKASGSAASRKEE